MWNRRVITTNAVPKFIEDGGKIDYRPVETPKGWAWECLAVDKDGNISPVISSKTGDARVFKSVDALVNFHRRSHPKDEGVWIRLPPSDGTEADDEPTPNG